MLVRSPFGHPTTAAVAMTLALMKASDVSQHVPFHEEIFLSDGRVFYYHPTSTLTADDVFVVQPDSSQAGRYLLKEGQMTNIKLAVAFGTADAAVLATLPTNSMLRILGGYWEVTADFTGGASSAIGLSSSNADANTKGDILGGAAGDVAANLTAGAVKRGTVGAKIAGGVTLVGGNTIRFDRITSAFTAGSGFAHLVGAMLLNPGA